MAIQKSTIIKWLLTTLWVSVGAGIIVLLVAAIHKKDKERCNGVSVNIHAESDNFFVDKKDILTSITTIVGSDPEGEPVNSFNLKRMEGELVKNIWLQSAQLFFDNNGVLQVDVVEREPVARVFTTTGTTFYIDSSIAMLPLSDKFSARVPVFTGFPSDKMVLTPADSSLLKDIKMISLAIQKDSFSMAMIDQVDITPQRTFEMIPKLGGEVILFGDAKEASAKLNKLRLFYKEVMIKAGWNYYSVVNVQYKEQVVAKRRGAEDKTADSVRTLQLMQMIAANAKRHAEDSVQAMMYSERNDADSSIIQESMQRDDNDSPYSSYTDEKPLPQGIPALVLPKSAPVKAVTPVITRPTPVVVKKPVVIKPVNKETKPGPVSAKKTAPKKPVANPVKPKVVMPKSIPKKSTTEKPKNDY